MKSIMGRVAMGARRFGEHVVGEATKVAEEVDETESEVEALLQRLSGASMHPEYRREAMAQLKDMLADRPKAQLAFGSMGGVPLLMSILQEDRDDLGLIRGALECFVHAMRLPPSLQTHQHFHHNHLHHSPAGTYMESKGLPGGWGPPGGGLQHQEPHPYQQLLVPHAAVPAPASALAVEAQAAAINAELLARRQENVLLLLALLEDEPVGINDFYVRYYTVQLLTVLLQSCSFKLQDAILSSRGVVRLMDMLAEREIIRNEALVLLVALTHANEEVQKIAAFEGAFDRVFHIIKEEGGTDGGVVVQDCLELLNNLLRANEANQRLFREMGYVNQLVQLLSSSLPANTQGASLEQGLRSLNGHLGEDSGLPISQQKACILLCALETVMLLVAPMPEARSAEAAAKPQDQQSSKQANTGALLQQGMLEVLLPLCLKDGGVASPAVSAQSLSALGDLVDGNNEGQQKLGMCIVAPKPGVPPVPVLQAALRVALHSPEPSKRAAAEHVIQAFCQGNPEGQAVLASTLVPVPRGSKGMPSTFGGELGAALCLGPGGGAAGLEVSCRAASVLQHLLAGNAAVKERLLQLPVELPPSASTPPELLLQRCFRLLSLALQSKEPTGNASTLLLLRTLLVWLHENPAAIARTVANAGHLPQLVDIVNDRQGPECARVQGLAAVLLGVCMLHGHLPASCPQQQSPLQQWHQQYWQHESQQIPSPTPPSDLVFDVLIARVGLGQYMAKLDSLYADPAFLSASSSSVLPHQVTRAFAAAATADGDKGSQPAHKPHPSSAPHPSSTLGSNNSSCSSSQSQGGGSSFPFDRAFTVFVRGVEGHIRQHVIHAFARPKAPAGRHVAAASPTDLLGSLPGTGEAEKLRAAAEAMLRLGRVADELQAHNLALKQELGRTAQQQQQLSSGQSQPASDAQVRAQAEERAGNAEAELAAVRQQVELLSARLAQAEQDAAAAQEASATSFSHAAKCEGDLSALGDHCHMMEAQIRELQALLAQAHQQIQQQQELQRQQQEQAPPSVQVGVPEDEVAHRVEEAVSKAVAEADANNEEQLTDLLVCLGQEEQKVSALREKLTGLGVDVEALLASIQPEEEGEEGGEDGDELQ